MNNKQHKSKRKKKFWVRVIDNLMAGKGNIKNTNGHLYFEKYKN